MNKNINEELYITIKFLYDIENETRDFLNIFSLKKIYNEPNFIKEYQFYSNFLELYEYITELNDRKYISIFLNYLTKKIDKKYKEILIDSINGNNDFKYFNNNNGKQTSFSYENLIGNIYYNNTELKIKSDNIFWFSKLKQDLYIYYVGSDGDKDKYIFKKVQFDSDYEVLANYLDRKEDGIINKEEIEKNENRTFAETLPNMKKYLGFNNILNHIFFDGSNKGELIFNKYITKEILDKKMIEEYDVMNYLRKRYDSESFSKKDFI